MARIRTIKPEFPQSESMGRVSREARLLFIQLWTLADDSGRLRGNSRMLASLLYPYDDDARTLIDAWLDELDREGCVWRYSVDGDTYLEIRNWLIHQKIDKPSRSKIPAFDESSRILANPRERSCEDQGSRIKDQGPEPYVELKLDSPPGTNREPETNQQVLEVFSHWQTTWNKPRAKLDPKRRRLIHQALKLYDSDTLKRSIAGYKLSPHHCGQNERSTVYDDIELFLRDAKHIDAGVAFAEKGVTPVFR